MPSVYSLRRTDTYAEWGTMVVLFFEAYVKPYPDDQSSNLAQCLTKKTAFLSHRRSNGMLLTPTQSWRVLCAMRRYSAPICAKCVWHHTIPLKDVAAVIRFLPITYGGHVCVKRCAHIAVDVFGAIPLVFRRICISGAPVNVASSVRTYVRV